MLWQWIRTERKSRGWTQTELAARAGISTQAISAGEKGRREDVTSDTLVKLAGAFGLSVDALLSAAGLAPTTLASLEAEGVPRDTIDEVAAILEQLPPADQQRILEDTRRAYRLFRLEQQSGQRAERGQGQGRGEDRPDVPDRNMRPYTGYGGGLQDASFAGGQGHGGAAFPAIGIHESPGPYTATSEGVLAN